MTSSRRWAQRTLAGAAVLLAGAPVPAEAQGSMEVAVRDNRYEPALIEIHTGTTVEWTNLGLNPHTVTSQPGAPESFESGTMGAQAGTFSFTFQSPGTYHYYCRFHGSANAPPPSCGMCGTVLVSAAASEPVGPTPGRAPTARPAASEPPRSTPTPTPTPTELVLAPADSPDATPELADVDPTPMANGAALASGDREDGGSSRTLVAVVALAVFGGAVSLAWYRRRMLR